MFNRINIKKLLFNHITLIITIALTIIGFGLVSIYLAPNSKAATTTPIITELYTTANSYEPGGLINVQWRITEPVPYGEWFVGLYSSSGEYYDYIILSAGNGSNSTGFSYNVIISTAPIGDGYRAVVAYRPSGSDWISVTGSSNTFSINEADSDPVNPVDPDDPDDPKGVVKGVISNELCRIDVTTATISTKVQRAKSMATTCLTEFPKIEQILSNSPCPALHGVTSIKFTDEQNNLGWGGYASGCVVYINNKVINNKNYLQKSINGLMVHELAHVVQNYVKKKPSYMLEESIASYVAHKLGYNNLSNGYGYCDKATYYNKRFDSGYECGSVFLRFIELKYSINIVKIIHTAVENESYTDSIFADNTKDSTNPNGLSAEQLYKLCLQAECKGGAS